MMMDMEQLSRAMMRVITFINKYEPMLEKMAADEGEEPKEIGMRNAEGKDMSEDDEKPEDGDAARRMAEQHAAVDQSPDMHADMTNPDRERVVARPPHANQAANMPAGNATPASHRDMHADEASRVLDARRAADMKPKQK